MWMGVKEGRFSFLEKFIEKLTIIFVSFRGGSYRGKILYRYGDYCKDVYVFQGDDVPYGQATPWNAIIMSDHIFKNFSKNVADYVFLHEYGHTNLHFLLRILFYAAIVPLLILFIGSVVTLLLAPVILLAMGADLHASMSIFLYFSSFAVVFALTVVLVSWPCEILADFFAIKTLGRERYLEAISEIRKMKRKERDVLHKLLIRLLYPPYQIVLLLYDLRYLWMRKP